MGQLEFEHYLEVSRKLLQRHFLFPVFDVQKSSLLSMQHHCIGWEGLVLLDARVVRVGVQHDEGETQNKGRR